MKTKFSYLFAFFAYIINAVVITYMFSVVFRSMPSMALVMNRISLAASTCFMTVFYIHFLRRRKYIRCRYATFGCIGAHIIYFLVFIFDKSGNYFLVSSYAIGIIDTVFLLVCALPRANLMRVRLVTTLRAIMVLTIIMMAVECITLLLRIDNGMTGLIISYFMTVFCYIAMFYDHATAI